MKKKPIALIIVCAAACILIGNTGSGAGDIRDLQLPPVTASVMDNGLKIFYIKDELPQLTIVASIGYGKLYETRETAGTAELIAQNLLVAGSRAYPGQKLHAFIESIGGKISIDSSWENTLISVRVLKRFAREAFEVIADLMANPNFNQGDFDTARSLVIEEIKRNYDDPANIAFEKTREIIFDGGGYGVVLKEDHVRKYTLDDVRNAWQKYCCAKNILMGISTSISFDEVKKYAHASFSPLVPGQKIEYAVDHEKAGKTIESARKKIFLYVRDIPQATIVAGTIAPRIADDAQYALSVMNYILGGGSFNSRLMYEIRVKRGLAYSVQSLLRARSKTGVFLAFAQTQNESAATVLSLFQENFSTIAREKITAQELQWSQDSINNSFVFNFDTPSNILGNYIDIAYNNLPDNYFQEYLKQINMVTDEDVLRETGKLFAKGFVFVIVGKESLKEKLSGFGEVVLLRD